MNKFIVLAASFMISNFLYAKECGPKAKEGKDVFTTMIECGKDQTNCLELKDTTGVFYKVDPSTKMFFKIKSAQFIEDMIHLEMDSKSSCWFEKVTGDNAGKRMAIVNKDIILTFPVIQMKIEGGKVQIGATGSKDINLALCQSLFSGCKEEKSKIEKPIKGSFLDKLTNPPKVNRKELNARYGSVMESTYWVTDQIRFIPYEDSSLKKPKKTYHVVPMTISKKNTAVPLFYGIQEFDMKTKKYVFVSNAIKLRDIGWVKREDIVPFNVVDSTSEVELQRKLMVGLLSKKCAGFLNAPEEEIQQASRDIEIALCVKMGQPECEDFISKTQGEVDKVTCPKSPK